MKYTKPILNTVMAAALVIPLGVSPAAAHFQLIWFDGMNHEPNSDLELDLVFTHVFGGGPTMEMAMPEAFYLVQQGGENPAKRTDLAPYLEAMEWQGIEGQKNEAWRAQLPGQMLRSLGDYTFALEPVPYFEGTEDKYIQQFTKVVGNIGGVPGNWDSLAGLPVEIRALTRPYGNWLGASFSGQVMHGDTPVPFAEIEIEYLNFTPDPSLPGWSDEGKFSVPYPVMENVSIRADQDGVFSFNMVKPGWWGIAALDLVPDSMYEGKPLSQDAVLWVEALPLDE